MDGRLVRLLVDARHASLWIPRNDGESLHAFSGQPEVIPIKGGQTGRCGQQGTEHAGRRQVVAIGYGHADPGPIGMRFEGQLHGLCRSCRLRATLWNGLDHEAEVDSLQLQRFEMRSGDLIVLSHNDADVPESFLLGPFDEVLKQGLPVLSDPDHRLRTRSRLLEHPLGNVRGRLHAAAFPGRHDDEGVPFIHGEPLHPCVRPTPLWHPRPTSRRSRPRPWNHRRKQTCTRLLRIH